MIFPDLFSAPDWQPTAVGLVAVCLIALLWSYFRTRQAALWVRVTCGLLKAVGIGLLGLCLLEPMTTSEVPKSGANLFLVLADSSQSLQVRDAGSNVSREELLRQKLIDDRGWQDKLEDTFDLRKFTFARQVSSSKFDDYVAEGIGSSIVSSLDSVNRRYRGRPVAGILLFTDGNGTDLQQDLAWDEMPPIFPVVVGDNEVEADVSISRFSVSQTNFEAAPVNISADLSVSGFEGKKITAQVLNEQGDLVSEQEITKLNDQNMASVRFKVKPENPGVSVYKVRVAESSQLVAFDDPEASAEATMVNNQRTVVVDRARGPYRILYVSGRPNWEFKFLRRALLEDDEIDLVGLIRIANEEPKFTFRSHRDETTNSLFRGFGNEEDEEAERYNEPVLVRIGTRDAKELSTGFPISPEELFEYQAVILDDVEASYFDEDQKSLLNEFVVSRGGGFLMLGGQETFVEGKYDRTPIGDLLPVYVDTKAVKEKGANYRLSLTREGWLQPWVRIESTEPEEKLRLENMSGFRTVNSIRTIKPGASVLAKVETQGGTALDALVAHRVGKGRAAALLIGDFWRWHLQNESGNDDMLKAWRQMLRWLVADVPRRVDIDFQKVADANLSVLLKVSIVDEAYQPIDNADVQLIVTRPDQSMVELVARPLDEAAGLFGATYVPRQAGAYRVRAVAKASDGTQIGIRDSGWVSEPAGAEFESLTPNREFLESLASKTGGQVVTLSEVDSLVRRLPNESAPVMELKTSPWWHSAVVFLLALGCIVSEWGLRRWKGLA